METTPSEIYQYHILNDLPIEAIYQFCFATKQNKKYCDDMTFWQKFFANKSHTKIQALIMNAAKRGIFTFIKMVCENHELFNIFLDLRTLNYSYYYFAERDNLDAMEYLYSYMKENDGDLRGDDSSDSDSYSDGEYSPPSIVVMQRNSKLLKKLGGMVRKMNINTVAAMAASYAKLIVYIYPEYIAEFLVTKYAANDWTTIIKNRENIKSSNQFDDPASTYHDLIFEIFAYLVRNNKREQVDKIINKIINHFEYNFLFRIFIENCDYNWYNELYNEISGINKDNIDKYMDALPKAFRDKKVFEIYWAPNKRNAYLHKAYLFLSPKRTLRHLRELKINNKKSFARDIISFARIDGYSYWANIMTNLMENMK